MAKLSSFKVDSKAQEAGEWVQPGEEFDDLALKVRGFTDAYFDAQNAKLRRAAVGFGGDPAKVPSAVQRDIRVACLSDHVFLDVRNLVTDDGQPIGAETFRGLMQNPDHGDLVIAVMRAAAMVGRVKAADVEEAAGN